MKKKLLFIRIRSYKVMKSRYRDPRPLLTSGAIEVKKKKAVIGGGKSKKCAARAIIIQSLHCFLEVEHMKAGE